MKVTLSKQEAPPQFTPVEIKIVCESQKELDFFGAMSNSAIIGSLLSTMGVPCGFHYDAMKDRGANIEPIALHAALHIMAKKWTLGQ